VSGSRSAITTVGELVAALATYPPEVAVLLAVAPGYPQAATIGKIACSPDDADNDGREPDPPGSGWCGSAKAPRSGTCPRSPATPSATTGREQHRDLLIIVDEAAEPVAPSDLVDVGWRAAGERA
jgi:hypothetical protein